MVSSEKILRPPDGGTGGVSGSHGDALGKQHLFAAIVFFQKLVHLGDLRPGHANGDGEAQQDNGTKL